MILSLRLALAAFVLPFLAVPVAAEPAHETRVLDLRHADARDAMVAVRALVGARGVEITDDGDLRVTEEPDRLELAAAVAAMVDQPDGKVPEMATLEVEADGTRVARFGLEHASVMDVMTGMREILVVKNVAASLAPAMVIVRDEPEVVDRAIWLVRLLDRPCPSEG